jgi:hypothetical protein
LCSMEISESRRMGIGKRTVQGRRRVVMTAKRHFRHVRFRDKRHGLAPPELAQREGHLDVAALFLRNRSESSGEGFVWQRKSYEAGRGMWSKHLSSTELPNVPVERPSICRSVYG